MLYQKILSKISTLSNVVNFITNTINVCLLYYYFIIKVF
ncbi:hypothetical protein CLFO_06780 [Clostridium formicaceticum]|uniref:Uncharacterized protein n=1 Tax=Clostridium formicaceticum TaxID=1497 RepID=A0AAC9WF19_9CLOT|nr:hypothetical protein CLFO_06780 [Clostridium formicaceticum]